MFNNSIFNTTHIKAIHTPPNSLLGRCIAVRLKRSALDLLVVSVYFPPRSSRSDQRKKGEKTVDAILAWLRTIMSSAPYRTTPVICMDLNEQFTQKHRDDASDHIGPMVKRTREMGYAAHGMMKFAKDWDLAIATTHHSTPPHLCRTLRLQLDRPYRATTLAPRCTAHSMDQLCTTHPSIAICSRPPPSIHLLPGPTPHGKGYSQGIQMGPRTPSDGNETWYQQNCFLRHHQRSPPSTLDPLAALHA